jgi:hypothetical protein
MHTPLDADQAAEPLTVPTGHRGIGCRIRGVVATAVTEAGAVRIRTLAAAN